MCHPSVQHPRPPGAPGRAVLGVVCLFAGCAPQANGKGIAAAPAPPTGAEEVASQERAAATVDAAGTPTAPQETLVVTPPLSLLPTPSVKKFADAFKNSYTLHGTIDKISIIEKSQFVKLEGLSAEMAKPMTGTIQFLFRTATIDVSIDRYHGQLPDGEHVPTKLSSYLVNFDCHRVVDPTTGAVIVATVTDHDDGGWHMRRCRWMATGYDITLEYHAGNPTPAVGQEIYFNAALPTASGKPWEAYSATLKPVMNGKVWFQEWAVPWSGSGDWTIWKSIAPYGMDLATFEQEMVKHHGPAKPAPSPVPAVKLPESK